LCVFVSTSLSRAGEDAATTNQGPVPIDKFADITLAFRATNYFDATFPGLNTTVDVARYSAYGIFKFQLGGPWLLKISAYSGYSLYDFDSHGRAARSSLAIGALRETVLGNVDATVAYTFTPGWAVLGGGRITTGLDTNASFINSITGGGILAVKKSFFDGGVDLTLGASYTTRLSRSGQIFPYIDFDVNVLPSFIKAPIDLLVLYNGGLLTYRLSDRFSLLAMGQFDSRAYRLASDSTVPRGVWNEYGVNLGGGFSVTSKNRNYSLNVFAGYEVFRNVQIFANSGNQLFNRAVSPTPFLSIDIQASF
jgi:hypothetical protein